MQTYIILCLGIILGAFFNLITYKISGSIFLISLIILVICKKLFASKFSTAKLALIFVCGFSYSACTIDYRNSQQLTQNISKIHLTGYINSPVQNKNNFNQSTFHITKGTFSDQNIILRYNESYDIQAGYNYQITVNLQSIKNNHNIEAFDNQQNLLSKNIFALGNLRSTPQQLTKNHSLNSMINLVRCSLIKYLQNTLGSDKYAGTVIAMVTGYQGEIANLEWDMYRRTGILHLVSVSGLPLELVAISFIFIFGLICKLLPSNNIPRQIITIYASIVLTIIYALISGFGIPTQRVLFMVIIAGFLLINRLYIPLLYKLIISLTLVLIFDPFAIFNLGFWFSYMLVASMFIVITIYKSNNKLKIWLIMQLSLALVTIPLSLYYFSGSSISSPIANLWAVPIIGTILTPFMFLSSIFHLTPLIKLLYIALEYAMKPIEWLNVIPMYWQTKPNLANILLAYLGIIVLILPLPFRGKNIFAILLIVNLAFTYNNTNTHNGQANIVIFSNINAGFSLINTENHHILLINRNHNENIDKSFDYNILPYLQSRNIKHLDYLISNQNESELIQHLSINNMTANIHRSNESFIIDNVSFSLIKQQNSIAILVKTTHNINYIGNCLKTNTVPINNIFILMPYQSCSWLLSGKYDNLIINNHYDQQRKIDALLNNLYLDAKNAKSLSDGGGFELFSD